MEYLRTIDMDNDILKGRRAAEENTKIKIVVPLFESLGWSVAKDMDFEHQGADIVLLQEGRIAMVVETKSIGTSSASFRDQCIEYCLKTKTPWVVLTTGEYTRVCCCLPIGDGKFDLKDLFEFSLNDFLGKDGPNALDKVKAFLGKATFETALHEAAVASIEGAPLEDTYRHFTDAAAAYKGSPKSLKIRDPEFFKEANKHKPDIRDAILLVREGLEGIVKLDRNIHLKFLGKGIGFEYWLHIHPRTKKIGLFGVYPHSAKISFGLIGWQQLKLPEDLLQEISNFGRTAESPQWAQKLIDLLRRSVSHLRPTE